MKSEYANCGVDGVIITGDLDRRPSRAPDFEAESRAFAELAKAISSDPNGALQRLVDTVMELTRCDSAGISLLEPGGGAGTFRWAATAGAWGPYRDGEMPREENPCGEVIAREAVLLVKEPARAFPALLQAEPSIGEGLLAPFDINRMPGGTVWAIMHSRDRQFEAEDARLLKSLAQFASVAHIVALSLRSAGANRLESDTRLRTLARASSDVFYSMNADMSELRELSGGDFIANTASPSRAWLQEYIPQEDHERTAAAMSEAIRTKGVFELEHRVLQTGSGVGWALSRAVPIIGSDGQIFEWFGAASDITTRKMAESALIENEEHKAFLLKLSDALRAEPSPQSMTQRALRMLSEQLQLDRCYVGVYHLEEDIGDFPNQVHDDRLLPLPSQVRLSDFPIALRAAFDRTLVISDVALMESLSDIDQVSFEGLGLRSLIAATLRKGEDQPLWAIVAASTSARHWSKGEVALVEEVAERTWSAIERSRAEAALRESETQFRQFSDASTNILWIRDAATMRMTFASPAYDAIYGIRAPDRGGDDRLRTWLRLIQPGCRRKVLDNFRRVRRGEHAEMEFQARRATDGALRWIHCTDFPLRDGAGNIRWLAGLGADITEMKQGIVRQDLLLAELQHRVRNILAMIRSVVRQSSEGYLDVEDFVAHLLGRLDAMARTQVLLTRAAGAQVDLEDLVRDELKSQLADEGRVTVGGSGVKLSPKAAEVLTLALHELATNSVKYGALSDDRGTLSVTWGTSPMEGETWLQVTWDEQCKQVQPKPLEPGFGTELIEDRVPYELGGEAALHITAGGVRAEIAFPLTDGSSILETGPAAGGKL